MLVLVAIVGACVTQASAAQEARVRPALSVTVPGPIVISGARFEPNERVTLRLVVFGRPSVKVVRSTAGGRLSARFLRGVPDCEGFTITATGNRGSRVTFRQLPPSCGIVIQP